MSLPEMVCRLRPSGAVRSVSLLPCRPNSALTAEAIESAKVSVIGDMALVSSAIADMSSLR